MPEQAEPQLAQIQAWLHTFVVTNGPQSEALRRAEAEAGFEQGSPASLIRPSPTLSSLERIQIYRGMYLMRMKEALEIDFPAVGARVGEAEFRALTARYVERHPSRSYTLDHLGRHFSDFLKEIDANKEGHFLCELAQMEWGMCEVAIAQNATPFKMTDLQSVASSEFLNLILEPVPALKLFQFDFNINECFKSWSRGERDWNIQKSGCRVVVWRSDLQVWRLELRPDATVFLKHLLGGATLGQSLDSTMEETNGDEETLFANFQEWVCQGFFATYRREYDRKSEEGLELARETD